MLQLYVFTVSMNISYYYCYNLFTGTSQAVVDMAPNGYQSYVPITENVSPKYN